MTGAENRVKELFRTNDPVLVSWTEALLAGEGVPVFVMDAHMSVLEGSAAAIPRRVMVGDDDFARARTLVEAARAELGLAADIRWDDSEPDAEAKKRDAPDDGAAEEGT